MRFIIVTALVGVAACYDPHSPHLPPVEPDYPPYAGDLDTDCANACGNLRRLGCPEGAGAISGETCERRCAVAMRLRPMPIVCWAAAPDVASAKSCGALRCVR